jgi:hypothetical protein
MQAICTFKLFVAIESASFEIFLEESLRVRALGARVGKVPDGLTSTSSAEMQARASVLIESEPKL